MRFQLFLNLIHLISHFLNFSLNFQLFILIFITLFLQLYILLSQLFNFRMHLQYLLELCTFTLLYPSCSNPSNKTIRINHLILHCDAIYLESLSNTQGHLIILHPNPFSYHSLFQSFLLQKTPS